VLAGRDGTSRFNDTSGGGGILLDDKKPTRAASDRENRRSNRLRAETAQIATSCVSICHLCGHYEKYDRMAGPDTQRELMTTGKRSLAPLVAALEQEPAPAPTDGDLLRRFLSR
jgi:hypothetical protein